MRYSRQKHLSAYASLLATLLIVCAGQSSTPKTATLLSSVWQSSVARPSGLYTDIQTPNTLEYRIAKRLQKRLRNNGVQSPSVHKIAEAVTVRQKLLKSKTLVRVENSDDTLLHTWEVNLQRYPLWIQSSFSLNSAKFSINTTAIAQAITEEIDPLIQQPTTADIQELLLDQKQPRVIANVARSGQEIDVDQAVEQIQYALVYDTEETAVRLQEKNGVVRNATDKDLGDMVLLASGKSNFTGSTWSRSFNVRKALREHVNNTLVAPGETFSFNNTLDGPVSLGNGWAMAKIIVNGADLENAPGGGICQASTTVYRAILHAGFPVTERKSHSLYVTYYKEYGVGIDATIYPGQQDLVFTNDTDNYLLIQAYDDGYDAIVNIYGTPDGRSVELQGPYFAENAPEDLRVQDRKMSRNEIAWLQNVTYPNGEVVQNTIVSRYRTLPNYVRNEYAYAE